MMMVAGAWTPEQRPHCTGLGALHLHLLLPHPRIEHVLLRMRARFRGFVGLHSSHTFVRYRPY